MIIELPRQVEIAINTMESEGFDTYVVGGCVRDSLREEKPKDWDLCTSAKPAEIMELLHHYKTIPTGLKHGTVTVIIDHMRLEITTYRVDGSYSDNRHPDQVNFTTSLEEDLARRDFTINAMAYNHKSGLVDPFGGARDIKVGLVRCVGQASTRFAEDALRILRGLRFASVKGFDIEQETGKAIISHRLLLRKIAGERINVELCKFIMGQGAGALLMKYREVFAVFMPEIQSTFDFDQRNNHHIYDVWEHTVRSVERAAPNEIVKLTLLLHDLGKPETFTIDDGGVGHFYGHPKVSEEKARSILNRLRFDNARKSRILMLVANHDVPLVARKQPVKRLLNKFGEENLRLLLEVKKGDALAQSPLFHQERINIIGKCKNIMEEIIEEEQCFSLKDLAINGKDLIESGYEGGPELGRLLKLALEAVIEEKVSNKKSEILDFLRKSNKKL